MPELYIKQCHMLANHIKQHYPGKDQDFFDQFIENPHGPYYTEFCEASGRDPAIHTFLDIADMAKKDGFKSVQIWENTMAHWKASMPEAFPRKQDFRQGGTVGIHSNKKYIMDYV
jgi:hypothetical protein